MKRKQMAWFLSAALLLLPSVSAAESKVYDIVDASGKLITQYSGSCETGDEYFSCDNKHYKISRVDTVSLKAQAEHIGSAELPDVSWLKIESSLPVSAMNRKIALYCTHSDESYITGDGSESKTENAGIFQVTRRFAQELEDNGIEVLVSQNEHHPHDAGAYRRSRQTAVELLKSTPSAIFDIHRDGIPDPDQYKVKIGTTDMSRVRILVGKSNQNKTANLSFAKQIKAIADEMYPGLIKDIYMGKGTYNQDLSPRSLLFEFGTHTISKERVLNAAKPMSEVVSRALFGGITGSAGASDVSRKALQKEDVTESKAAVKESKGSGGIVWLFVLLIGGLAVFAFLSGGKSGGNDKFKRSFSEMTGGLFGKKPPKS